MSHKRREPSFEREGLEVMSKRGELSDKNGVRSVAVKKVGGWKEVGTMLVYSTPDCKGKTSMVSFDMDDTVIRVKSGKKWPKDRHDWTWWHASVPGKLKKIHEAGSQVVIFTNQKGITSGASTKKADIKAKIEMIIEQLGIPVQAFVATDDDLYRKPGTGMFQYFESSANDDVPLVIDDCLYVGDAAGRLAGWGPGKKKDFSGSDRKFAANCGIEFKTPEEYFFNASPISSFSWGSTDPRTIQGTGVFPTNIKRTDGKQEMVIMVGFPASGKSTFAKKYFVNSSGSDYVHVNRDTLKTQDKCVRETKNTFERGGSVVIDNTNPTTEARKRYIDLAKSSAVPVRCFHFDMSKEVALHMNKFRQKVSSTKNIPIIAYHTYAKRFVLPQKSEGIDEVVTVPFIPEFEDERAKKLFLQWT
eukprot:TRINITY_DN15214_c0_g1_i1.p1 TRINITY_DN15214_c0_g1~~TRINITY_DN15214_c0_g1_i1.p1  ORF type:complete len:444 (+),score=117.93 TRINITY_DN15214_c0_g1_i1:85-1332(+)